eukprot:Skav233778  [mRNA]  locus=scaffold780:154581:159856:- [translate_table: standard]
MATDGPGDQLASNAAQDDGQLEPQVDQSGGQLASDEAQDQSESQEDQSTSGDSSVGEDMVQRLASHVAKMEVINPEVLRVTPVYRVLQCFAAPLRTAMCKKMGWDVESIEESNARVLGFKEYAVLDEKTEQKNVTWQPSARGFAAEFLKDQLFDLEGAEESDAKLHLLYLAAEERGVVRFQPLEIHGKTVAARRFGLFVGEKFPSRRGIDKHADYAAQLEESLEPEKSLSCNMG